MVKLIMLEEGKGYLIYEKIIIVILSLILTLCTSKDGFKEAEEFYKKTKNMDVRILLNLMLIPRGGDGRTIQKIQINRFKEEPIAIPVFDDTDSIKFLDSAYFDIRLFAKINGVDESQAYAYSKAFSDSVIKLYNSLDVISVKSYPDLGSFIIFQVTTKDEVIYLEDKSKVYHTYWLNFFEQAQKFDDHWYYRKL